MYKQGVQSNSQEDKEVFNGKFEVRNYGELSFDKKFFDGENDFIFYRNNQTGNMTSESVSSFNEKVDYLMEHRGIEGFSQEDINSMLVIKLKLDTSKVVAPELPMNTKKTTLTDLF